jgi:hypothetical protein
LKTNLPSRITFVSSLDLITWLTQCCKKRVRTCRDIKIEFNNAENQRKSRLEQKRKSNAIWKANVGYWWRSSFSFATYKAINPVFGVFLLQIFK